MAETPVIIVHSVEQAVAALKAASELKAAVTLQTAPDALRYAGSLYLLHMFSHARQQVPEANATCILDCGDATALFIGALMDGHRLLRLNSPPELDATLADIAAQYGACVFKGRAPALDLAYERNQTLACKQWLKEYAKD